VSAGATAPPAAFGAPVLSARMRCAPEDFRVEERDAFAPSGSGEHVLLTIEKRGMNTAFVAGLLARWAGVPAGAVGYAGLKDRHAVTVQRFTVQVPGREPPPATALEALANDASGQSLRVLEFARHARKLPRGALAGNRFVLVLREVRGVRGTIDARLRAIAARGCPNAFGGQRFGHDGGNIPAAMAMFEGRRVRREQRAILLSAARSELFNRVLSARVADGSWDRGLEGEVWMLDGSHSVFGPEPAGADLTARVAASDIHPTGPLWGRGMPRSTGAAVAIELAAIEAPDALRLRLGLEAAGLRQERRALRMRVEGLAWDWRGGDALEVSFALPPGSYATSVLAQLGEVGDAGRP
jgi:tRNA pseudouridine13 synthase